MTNIIHATKKVQDLANKISDNIIMHAVNKIRKMLINEFIGSGITLTKNEIKDIKVIRSLENREILLKRITKINSQDGELLNCLIPLISSGLPLIKNLHTPLAKSILVLLGLTAPASAADAAIKNKIFGLGKTH